MSFKIVCNKCNNSAGICGGGCGKKLPNKTGLWIGNDWLEINIKDRKENINCIVCKECAKKKTINEIMGVS